MGFISNKFQRNDIKAGDHIYTSRAGGIYCHHGIFVGDNTVVHFTSDAEKTANSNASFASYNLSMSSSPSTTIRTGHPDCGFRQPESGVFRSCLDCFLGNNDVYRYDYGVSTTAFYGKKGGSCTIARPDEPDTVIHRAMYLPDYGFGNYNLVQNNCEDFALYCKTGLSIVGRVGNESSGQISAVIGGIPWFVAYMMPTPIRAACLVLTTGWYCVTRYANDIGVRTDVENISVEDLVERLRQVN